MRHRTVLLFLATVMLIAIPAAAQDRPRPLVEGAVGFASFVDEAYINFRYFGGGGRAYVTRRVAIGPEVIFMNGPERSRQWHFTGNVTVDLVSDRRRVIPYIVAAGGYQRMTTQTGRGLFTSSEGSVSGGVGARVALSDNFFVAPEFRMGWEPHFRFGATFGARF